jgi:hypothetical protein
MVFGVQDYMSLKCNSGMWMAACKYVRGMFSFNIGYIANNISGNIMRFANRNL